MLDGWTLAPFRGLIYRSIMSSACMRRSTHPECIQHPCPIRLPY
jgi:hypothetical protein